MRHERLGFSLKAHIDTTESQWLKPLALRFDGTTEVVPFLQSDIPRLSSGVTTLHYGSASCWTIFWNLGSERNSSNAGSTFTYVRLLSRWL